MLSTVSGGCMKKLQLSNKYVHEIELSEGNAVTLFASNDKMFQLLLKRLALFSETVDTGTEKIKRQFTYTSDPNRLTITFELDPSQAFSVLHANHFTTDKEHSSIQAFIGLTKKTHKYSSVLDCLKAKRRTQTPINEETSLLPENK